VQDALGRAWQLSTIQFDFNLPARFGLEYSGEDGRPHQPYMVHRALLGSMERFFGVLIEHFAGAFPVWLAPVQGVVIPISTDRHLDYARAVVARLAAAGLRVEVDDGKDRMQAKIRRAQLHKAQLHKGPYMLVVGSKEQQHDAVAVRLRSVEELAPLPVDSLITRV
jgi:threonyl-tRNA synthetase